MTELMLAAALFLPLIMAVVASAVSWRSISNRALFPVVTALSLFGLQNLVAPVAAIVFQPIVGVFPLPVGTDAFVNSVLLSAAIQLVLGTPIIWWLYRAFRKP
jgi:ABC-type sugar transport system permease subunit